MSEGEFKKRAVHEAYIDFDDIIQRIGKDKEGNNFLSIELPDEKYLVRMKDLFSWLDEVRKDLEEDAYIKAVGSVDTNPRISISYKKWLKWFGDDKK